MIVDPPYNLSNDYHGFKIGKKNNFPFSLSISKSIVLFNLDFIL